MAEERTYYVICEDNCRFESMTKEEILTAITNAVQQGSFGDIDTGFVTKIKEQNRNVALKFWVGTQAEYNALSPKPNNTFCIITDDEAKRDIETAIADLQADMSDLENKKMRRAWGVVPIDESGRIHSAYIDDKSMFLLKVVNSDSSISYHNIFVPLTKISDFCLAGSKTVFDDNGIVEYIVKIEYEQYNEGIFTPTAEKVICYHKNGDTLALTKKQTDNLIIGELIGVTDEYTVDY